MEKSKGRKQLGFCCSGECNKYSHCTSLWELLWPAPYLTGSAHYEMETHLRTGLLVKCMHSSVRGVQPGRILYRDSEHWAHISVRGLKMLRLSVKLIDFRICQGEEPLAMPVGIICVVLTELLTIGTTIP